MDTRKSDRLRTERPDQPAPEVSPRSTPDTGRDGSVITPSGFPLYL